MMNHMTNEDFEAFKKATIQTYMHGWCHVMALAIQRMVGGTIVAQVIYDEDANDDFEFQVDHLMVRLPNGNFCDIEGVKDTFKPDHDYCGVFDVDEEWIVEQVELARLKEYTEEDVVAAGRIYSWIS